MIQWSEDIAIYLHREAVDFRKAINGLSVLVEAMGWSVYQRALFVFCNKKRTQLKVLYWDESGYALWQKRLEEARFYWPRSHSDDMVILSHEQWHWLLRGLDISRLRPHSALKYGD